MTTANELGQMVGSHGLLKVENWRVEVVVIDAKVVYGCQRFLVEPVAGSGRGWVDVRRIEFGTVAEELGL